jgi:hypothetical protein
VLQATASLEDPDWTEVPGGAITPVAGPIPCNEVAVGHGLFAVTLDFGLCSSASLR